ncbi:MAG: DUF1501 domain-containing protein [Planctomycetes bacterium]|nr:DUF1501 domain-containing protein [Planctomycetota bacterium]
MNEQFHRETEIELRHGHTVGRREFFRRITLSAGAAGFLSWADLVTAKADQIRQDGRACILLWMQGGPSQFETFSPKPGHENGGETKAIDTRTAGLQFSENLPELSRVTEDLCLIRSMTSKEGNHPRATYLLHTGYLPTASLKYPTLGSVVARERSDRNFDLPSFVRIGRGRQGNDSAGFLGVEYDPFVIGDPNRLPDNTTLPTDERRFQRRLRLLGRLETDYANRGGKQEVVDHEKLYAKASKMILSSRMEAFDVNRESSSVREAYGTGDFATGCLLARRLIEAGVTFVEVTAGSWDTHDDNFDRCRKLCGDIDRPFAQLIRDLRQRGLLDKTLVVWMGEFGRTPKINPRGGRDHYPRAFDVVLAGAGVRGGQVIGRTDAAGADVKDEPVAVNDLFQTLCHSMKIDANQENMSSIGRPIKVVDGGQVVGKVFG